MAMRKQLTGGLTIISLLFMLGTSTCTWEKRRLTVTVNKPIPAIPEPTCQEALFAGLQGLSDNEVAGFLEKGLTDDGKDECWIEIMNICLNENREIPHKHLVEAVKTFNMKRHEDLFHKAVYRYLSGIAKGKTQYRAEDRTLLENYCSLIINNAKSLNDKNLGQTQVLCKKLDPDLYSKFFR